MTDPQQGASTAYSFNVQYRIGRIAKYLHCGEWLDYGCADGGYTNALLRSGAAAVTGVDVAPDRIEAARKAHPDIPFSLVENEQLPFSDGSFDGVFMNEGIEHVTDEDRTLEEVYRVLRRGGPLHRYIAE